MVRPTRTARDAAAESAPVQVRVVLCAAGLGPETGFAISDDLQTGSIDPLPPGCRVAGADEVTIRLESTSADGLPASTALARTGPSGALALSVPVGSGQRTARLTVDSEATGAAMTVSLGSDQPMALTLTLTAAPNSVRPDSLGTVAGSVDPADGGPSAPAGRSAAVLLLLGVVGLAVMNRRRAAGR